MYKYILFSLFILIGLPVNAQSINVHGIISNKAGKPISNAIVTLLRQGLKDTTDSHGVYSITKGIVAVLPPLMPKSDKISFRGGILELRLSSPAPVNVEIFNLEGILLKKEYLQNALAGVYRLNITENSRAANFLVIYASIGQRTMTFRCLPLHDGVYTAASSETNVDPIGGTLAKIAADIDSLRISAEGFQTKVVMIDSYDKTVDITLDSAAANVCLGCGKTDHPASGKATMTIDGTQREYILLLPDNYDLNKSYKLIFCPHWLGGTMNDVVSGASCNGPYYGLPKLANNTAIFVAPNGLKGSMGTGWENTNGRDIKFFKAMLNHFDSTLCIDQKRIFSLGFSYGGMMSFALGCAMNDVFRAIAPMSGAFYSGCDSSGKGPIAVWQAHGTSDNVVPPKDAAAARAYFLARNGCSNETTPVDPSPCVAYKGCKEGYPYIYCEFNGGHGVQNFAAAAIWTFFSQF